MQISPTLTASITAVILTLAANPPLRRAGRQGITYYGPVLEEGFKTGAALFFEASVPGAHLLFGILEALGDMARGGRRRLPAALCGVVVHTCFGLVTYFIAAAGYPVHVAVTVAMAAHIFWNTAVLKFSER